MNIVFLVFAMMTKSSPTICAIHNLVNSLIVFLANFILALNSNKIRSALPDQTRRAKKAEFYFNRHAADSKKEPTNNPAGNCANTQIDL